MKKVLVSVVFACSALGMLGARVGDGYVPQRSDYQFRTEVTTIDDDGTIIYDKVITYLTDARNHTDTLQSEALPLDTAYWSRQSIGEILEMDFNFDEIPDLQIGTGPMNSFGNFTYGGGHKVQPDDLYDIASCTKIFASTLAIMKLYDDGLIDLNTFGCASRR